MTDIMKARVAWTELAALRDLIGALYDEEGYRHFPTTEIKNTYYALNDGVAYFIGLEDSYHEEGEKNV